MLDYESRIRLFVKTTMKKTLYILLVTCYLGFSQSPNKPKDDSRIPNIKEQLELLSAKNPGLTDLAKTNISVNNITLSNFLLAISNAHKLNINIAPDLNQINIANNFSNVVVSDLLVFLCKEYHLTIDFSGSILSVKKYIPPIKVPEERIIPIVYNPENNTISIDAKNDILYEVFKRIMDESAKNLVFAPDLENKVLTSYIKDMPFDAAMDKMALANNLYMEKTKDGFYLFEAMNTSDSQNSDQNSLLIRRRTDLNYKILDVENKLLEVNFNHTSIASIIKDIGRDLDLNIFTATPLDKAGPVTFKTKSITFDDLLIKIFESQNDYSSTENTSQTSENYPNNGQNGNSFTKNFNAIFTFKKEANIYYFGTENQLSVRKVEVIHLMHRSVELLSDPSGGSGRSRTVGRSGYGSNYSDSYSFNNNGSTDRNSGVNRSRRQASSFDHNSQPRSNPSETIEAIIPDEISEGLDIKIDHELNSLYVTGSGAKIERLKSFINYIDKTVPVVLIEVMFVEVGRNNTIESGISWGIGDNPIETKGALFPTTDFTLGAKTINKVINGFDGFDRINLGKVVPNFFATVKAMESNGNLKIKSTPKLSTLNGHRATFSNGETSYYTVTQRNIYGTDNPQTSEITNYEPIDAELGLTIKPLVSGDGQVTLDIFVIQSSFGNRIDENAPPDISSREFSSIIRVQDQDIVVLGGLEEHMKKNSGSGVPFLARVPIIKWFFSSRKREASKAKLTVFIKPTIIY